ncbi:MAG TPA: hypothetical protein EYH31_01950 [Anaerolineae bacterium]|nr:hypothetical protein [Anaerolineae bacterium]
MVFDLVQALEIPLEQELALCLLNGLVTDTRCFRTSNTTSRVLAIATQLMEAGADLNLITERALNRKPLSTIRLWGQALPGVQLHNRIIWAEITQQMRQMAGASDSDGDGGLVSFLVGAHEVDVAVVFTEKSDGKVEVGFRANPGYNVADLALSLGGGGHPQAAGCTLVGPLSEVRARVLDLLDRTLAEQRRVRHDGHRP